MIERACVVCGAVSPESRCEQHRQGPWEANRRERKRSGWAEQKLNRQVMNRYGGQCHVCGGLGATHVDHVVPLSQGGSDGVENRRPIHATPCHAEKSNREATAGRTRPGG